MALLDAQFGAQPLVTPPCVAKSTGGEAEVSPVSVLLPELRISAGAHGLGRTTSSCSTSSMDWEDLDGGAATPTTPEFGSFGRSSTGASSFGILAGPPPTPARPRMLTRQDSLQETRLLLQTTLRRASSTTNQAFFEGDAHFEFVRIIGQSKMTEVFLVKNKPDGSHYAVKRSRTQFAGRADRERYLHEIKAARAIPEHPHVLRYYRAWQESGHFCVQMEFCDGGSLKRLLQHKPRGHIIPEIDIWKLIRAVASGLEHCHAHNVLHLDIKPDNIYIVLLANDTEPLYKIGDFGNAVLQGQWSTEEGDGAYVAPELLALETAASPACDVYSFGATIYEAAAGVRIPRGSGDDAWRQGATPFPEGYSSTLTTLLSAMLASDPARRPTAADVHRVAATCLHGSV